MSLAERDYFRGYRGHEQHPHMPSTGSEGRCDLCGGHDEDSKHRQPWRRMTDQWLRDEKARHHAWKERMFGRHYGGPVRDFWDTSQPARQKRLDAIPPAVTRPSGGALDFGKFDSGMLRPRTYPSLTTAKPDIEILSKLIDKHMTTKEVSDMSIPITRRFGGDHLVKYLFAQDKQWIDASGANHDIQTMELDHALNTLLMMERVAEDLPFPADELQEKPLYKALYKRVKDALTGIDVGPPEPALRMTAHTHVAQHKGMWVHSRAGIEQLLRDNLPPAERISRRVEIQYTAGLEQRRALVRPESMYSATNETGALRVTRPYVVAMNLDAAALRTYRLDAITAARQA